MSIPTKPRALEAEPGTEGGPSVTAAWLLSGIKTSFKSNPKGNLVMHESARGSDDSKTVRTPRDSLGLSNGRPGA